MKWTTVLLLLGSALSCSAQSLFHQGITELLTDGDAFPFGVASGDPRQEQVVLWSKVLPEDIGSSVEVEWVIALDTQLTQTVNSGTVTTDSSSAFTLHVTATGLRPGTTYFYRFAHGQQHSAIGRTRTAPTDPSSLRFAVASCANYPAGHFNGYALIALEQDIDAVIHLGDYIYEYGNRGTSERGHLPPHEILTLNDYRSRYAQYRLDPHLQEAHRLHPFIAIWDDHEFANDNHRDGAQSHQPDEGEWEVRKATARKVYFEWLPVEQPQQQSIIRSFEYGALADLFMLDGRLQRSAPVADFNDPALNDTTRTKLGREQTDWLTTGLRDSQAKWKLIGNNVMFSVMDLGKFAKERQRNMDAWDGYPANRAEILDTLEAHDIRNVVVLTGDIHTAWAIELTRDPMDPELFERKSGRGVIGAEFVTPSISSKNLDEMRGKVVARLAASYIRARKRNPHLRYANLMDHGFMRVELTATETKATWVYSRTVRKPTLKTKRGRSFVLPLNGTKLLRARP